MTNQSNFRRYALTGLVLGAAIAVAGPASAGSKLVPFFGSTMTFNGTTETTANSNVDPFVVQLFSAGNECLRIAVTSQGTDLEATLVSPDGRTWRDDDGGGSLRPLVKAITVRRGWHILRLSHFNGAAVNADFSVQVLRTTSTSSLCTPPTSPVTSFSAMTQKPATAVTKLPGGSQ